MSYSADSLILGSAQASPAQAARLILARPHGAYTETDIAGVIVPAYWRVCRSAGLDPVLAVAQLIHETGNLSSWWSQRPRRNPAGIGVTGRSAEYQPIVGKWAWNGVVWAEGCSFVSWEQHAIPAHVGRLLAYALRDDQATSVQQQLIRRALAVRALPAGFRGAAPSWRGLNGRWAVPGTTYADSIAAIANAIGRM